MDYKEKYEQALENMRKFRDALNNHEILDLSVPRKEIVTDIEYYFPELKESEDERIRKAVIEMIHDTPNIECEENYNVRKEDVIAWLEKQGEKKPIDKVEPKFKVGDTMRTLQEANDGYTDGMPVVVSIDNEYYRCTNELIAIKDQDDYEFPPINVKQKPIEWKDSDEKYLFRALLSIQKDIAASEISGVNTKDLNDCVKWLYSLKQRIGG